LLEATSETRRVKRDLLDIQTRFNRIRSRVIYLEGEVAVYKRFAVIHDREPPGRPSPGYWPSPTFYPAPQNYHPVLLRQPPPPPPLQRQ
jgi:hypothetical protein